jgi:ubiquinone/menaquinone biosynthesis C-methylase UbiE
MNIEALASSKIGKIIARIAGAAMESRLRYRFSGPTKIQLIGDQGCLVAMDVLSDYIERVSKKVQAAELKNVHVVKSDAMDTGLDAESIDTVLLFSVIPSPTLPLNRFLPEMHRVLKPEGTLAVTTFPWVHRSICRSGLFTYISKRNGVYNYRRC